jgi:hypothetical protein
MCDIDLKTCEKSSKYKKKDIVDLGKKCGVDPYLANGREKTRRVICTEIVNNYVNESEEEDDPICNISKEDCENLDMVDIQALGEHCDVNVYSKNGNLKPQKTICKLVNKKYSGSEKPDLDNMTYKEIKKLAKQLDIDWKNKGLKDLQYQISKKLNSTKVTSRPSSPLRSQSPVRRLVSPPNLPPQTNLLKTNRAADLMGRKVSDLKELAKSKGLKKWNGKTPSRMLKQDFIDFLLQNDDSPRGDSPAASPRRDSPIVDSPVCTRVELTLLTVPKLKEIALKYGLKKFKNKPVSQLRKNDFIDFIVLTTQRSPSPKPNYKSKDLVAEDSDSGEIVVKKVRSPSPRSRSRSPSPQKRRSRSPSPQKRRSRSPSPRRSRSPSPRRSRSPSPRRSRSPSPQKRRPRSPSPQKRRSRSPSPQKRRPRSPSPRRSRSPSPRRSRSPSPQKRRPRSPSPQKRRSRSPSPPKRRSRSPSPPKRRSRSPSPPKRYGRSKFLTNFSEYKGLEADRNLDALAKKNNYKVVDVVGDGNCLFRAISKSLRLNYNLKYNHRILRSMVAEYLSENKKFVEPYLEYVTRNSQITPEQYIEYISKDGQWGDIICLKVLSEILKVKFNLLILSNQNFQLVSNDDSYTTIVPLGYIDNKHYTCLVPIDKPIQPTLPSIRPSVVPPPPPEPKVPPPSIRPSVKPSVVPPTPPEPKVPPPSIRPPSVKPSVVPPPPPEPEVPPPSIRPPSVKPSVVPPPPEPEVPPTQVPPPPQVPPPTFGSVKPLSSVNELLEIMDRVKPYVYDDISQLQKAEKQIMISLGM